MVQWKIILFTVELVAKGTPKKKYGLTFTKANQLPWQEDTPLPWQLAMVRGIAGSDLTVKFPGGKEPRMVGVGAIGEPWPVKLPLKTKEYPNIP